jgi:hypothetical protein
MGRGRVGVGTRGPRSDQEEWGSQGRPVEASGPQEVIGEPKRDEAKRGKALGTRGMPSEGSAKALEAAEGFRRGLQ